MWNRLPLGVGRKQPAVQPARRSFGAADAERGGDRFPATPGSFLICLDIMCWRQPGQSLFRLAIGLVQSKKGPICVSYTVFYDPVGRSSERLLHGVSRPSRSIVRENVFSLTIDLLGRETPCYETQIGPFVDCDGSPQCLSLRIEHCLFGGLSSSCQ